MTTPETTKHTPTLTAEVLALSKKMQEKLAYDKAATAVTESKEGTSLYDENLPDGFTPPMVKTIKDYDATFIAAGLHAAGTLIAGAMAKDKKLERATAELRMGHKDSVSFTVDRSKTYSNHLVGDGQEVTKYGVATTVYDVRAGRNAGQLKAARLEIGELISKFEKK